MSENERLKKEYEKARYNGNAYALRFIKSNLERQLITYNEQGNKHFSFGNYAQAIEEYKNALFIARLTEDTIEIKSALIVLANVYASTNQWKSAMECYDEATKLNIKTTKEKDISKNTYYQRSETFRFSYLDRWFLIQSKRFYIVGLVVTLLIFIVIGLATFFTKIPLLLYTLQLPILLLYVMSHYFLIDRRNEL